MSKNTQLMSYLEKSEGDRIWVAVPACVISGVLETLKSEQPDTIKFTRATLHMGKRTPIEVAEATVLISQISAWGDVIEDGLPEEPVLVRVVQE